MKFILGYLKIGLAIACTLAGIQVPGFVDQYGKNLNARLLESNNAVAEFKDDANRFFGGDLDRLVTHYKTSKDAVFSDGGNSIETIVNRNKELLAASNQFQKSPVNAYLHVFTQPLSEIRKDTWDKYSFGVVLNKMTLLIGVGFGFILLMLLDVSAFFGKKVLTTRKRSSSPKNQPSV